MLSSVSAQFDIPDVGPGGCVAVQGPDGKPLPCPGEQVVQQPPKIPVKPKQKLVPIDSDDPNGYQQGKNGQQGGITDDTRGGNGQASPECNWTCSRWSPRECRGGLQERICNCPCTNCDGDSSEEKYCPTSVNGYPNAQTGSYWHGEPVQFYLGETNGQLHLITGGGQLIEGIGLLVGTPEAKVPISTLLPPYSGYTAVLPGRYTARIEGAGEFTYTTATPTEDGFNLNFDVRNTAQVGMKEMTLNVMRNGQTVGSIPLVADVQQVTRAKEMESVRDVSPNSGLDSLMVVGFILFGIIAGILRFFFRKRKTAFGKVSLFFAILGLLFFVAAFFGLPASIFAILFSRAQKKRKQTTAGKWGLVLGILGFLLNLFMLYISMSMVY